MTTHWSNGWIRIWPWWQRVLHWFLAASALTALITFEGGRVHEVAGYGALAAAMLRIVLGIFGPRTLRFAGFTQGVSNTLAYLRSVLAHQEERFINHNPLGAWMVLALLLLCAAGAAMGWLYTTDQYWGVEWVILTHAWLTWPLLGLVAIHLLGVLHASLRHRENLVASMLHGKKRKN